MDGTRDRPPGKTAENWSRRDGIRAGAVTGPWRSAPREDKRTPASGKEAGVGVSPAAPEPEAATHPGAKAAGGWKPGVREWSALGVVVAVAIVGAALMFRVSQTEEAPVQEAAPEAGVPEAAVAEDGPGGAPAVVAPSDPALAGVTSVRLRIGPDLAPERKAAILAALAEAGVTGVLIEPLPFEIATSRVGYYRAADLVAAEALGRVVAPVIAPGGTVGVRDYGQLLADAEPGRLDLWIGE